MNSPTLEALLDSQAEAWSRGDRLLVEQLLARGQVAVPDRETVCCLIVGEILLRREAGETGDLSAEYERRFPEYAAEVWEEAALSNWASGEIRPVGLGPQAETPGLGGAPTEREGPPGSIPATAATIPDYHLLRVLGRGGFGTVWLARNLLDRGLVAAKLLKPGREGEIGGIRAYRRCASLHPHLLPILHVGQTAEGVYYTMPLADPLPGTPPAGDSFDYQPDTLGARLRRAGPLATSEVLDLLRQLLAALAELHRHGVVHSDVKPDNILRVEGSWKLGDLGLAVVTDEIPPAERGPGMNRGTRSYWPPEGCSGTPADDLFALARTLSQVWSVTATPVAVGAPTSTLQPGAAPDLDRFAEPPWSRERTDTPPQGAALRALLRRALSPEPAARYQSVAEMQRDLPQVLPVEAAGGRWRSAGRRAGGMLAMGLLLGAGWFAAGLGDRGPEAGTQPLRAGAKAAESPVDRLTRVKTLLRNEGRAAQALAELPEIAAARDAGVELGVEVAELRTLLGALPGGSQVEASLRVFFQPEPPALLRRGAAPDQRDEAARARDFVAEEREWLRWRMHDQREVLGEWPVELPWHRAVCDVRVAWQRRNLAHRLEYWGGREPPGLSAEECAQWLSEAESLRETALAEVAEARRVLRELFAGNPSGDLVARDPWGWSGAWRRADWLWRQLRLEGAGDPEDLPEELDRVAIGLEEWLGEQGLPERDHEGVRLHLRLVWLQQAQWGYAAAARDPGNAREHIHQADLRLAHAEARRDWALGESARQEWELSLRQTRDRREATPLPSFEN